RSVELSADLRAVHSIPTRRSSDLISAGPFGAADIVPSGDTGGGGGGAALVIVKVKLAETELPFCVAVTVQSRDPSSAVVKARPRSEVNTFELKPQSKKVGRTPPEA